MFLFFEGLKYVAEAKLIELSIQNGKIKNKQRNKIKIQHGNVQITIKPGPYFHLTVLVHMEKRLFLDTLGWHRF